MTLFPPQLPPTDAIPTSEARRILYPQAGPSDLLERNSRYHMALEAIAAGMGIATELAKLALQPRE